MVLGLSCGDATYLRFGLIEVSVVSKGEREIERGGWREEVEIKSF